MSVFRFSIAALLSILLVSARAQVPEQIDLKTCIDYALEHALSIREANLNISQTKTDYKETLGFGLPQITSELSFTDNAIIPTTFIPARGFAAFTGQNPNTVPDDAPDAKLTLGTRFVPRANLKLSQLVIDARYFIGLKAFENLYQLAEQTQKQTKTDLIYQITKAYYSILVNQERAKIFKTNLARLDTLLQQNQVLFDNGYLLSVDLKRLKVNYNNLKTEQRKIDYAIQIAKNGLKLQIGMPIEKKIELTEMIDTSKVSQLQLVGDDFHFDRIDYKMLKTQRKLNTFEIKGVKAGYYPKLYFDAVYGYNGGGSTLKSMRLVDYAFWGFRLQVPIFDGFQKRSQIQKLRLTEQKIDFALEALERQIRFEQEQTILNFRSAYDEVRNQAENQALAREVYDLTVTSYQEGLSSSSDLITAHTTYKEAQNNYYLVLLDLILAQLEYDKAFGNLEEE